jgi:hypothetical protein
MFSLTFLRAGVRGLLAVMLLAVLAPMVSRTLASTRVAGDWVEVCTTQGSQWVQLGESSPSPLGDDPAHEQHACGYCVLASERFAPLLPPVPGFSSTQLEHAEPTHRRWASLERASPTPGARGPPLLS